MAERAEETVQCWVEYSAHFGVPVVDEDGEPEDDVYVEYANDTRK
jgi:hypothetical protein